MENTDPTELAEQATNPFKTYCALLVSVLAMVLAICNLGGNNTGKDATMNNILASNMYSFYQAKSLKQTQYKIAADELEIQLASDKLTAAAKEQTQAKLAAYKKNLDRYESEPETGEGKKELMVKAKEFELERDLALKKDPWFDYAEGLLQLSIVLTSVAIITGRRSMALVALVLGTVGTVCTLNGYFLFF
jgi:hypothetical protein